ncbi:hypothetical protein [Paraburkholderia caballeronis]|uniref:hypothetical protein n=1 Tax=Paraburkholderia caballeronis TaxID=416943 RepID=UPI001416FA23|nr:hypothetical protein [Paraburkholderia caballeronis]
MREPLAPPHGDAPHVDPPSRFFFCRYNRCSFFGPRGQPVPAPRARERRLPGGARAGSTAAAAQPARDVRHPFPVSAPARRTPRRAMQSHTISPSAGSFVMRRIGAFVAATWLAAAILYLGRHSVPMIALSGVVALAGFDLAKP